MSATSQCASYADSCSGSNVRVSNGSSSKPAQLCFGSSEPTKCAVCQLGVCAGSAANSPVTSGSGSGAGSQIVAEGSLSCFVMKRADFERLLGPYEELWRYEALRKVSSDI